MDMNITDMNLVSGAQSNLKINADTEADLRHEPEILPTVYKVEMKAMK